MSGEPKGLDIIIMGREFRVACLESEQRSLLASVEYLDKKMREIRDGGKVVGLERIAIMAALNISHEHLAARLSSSFDVGEFRRRILKLQAEIDQAMSDQNELF